MIKQWQHDPLCKCESMEWRQLVETRLRAAEVIQSTTNMIITIFWDGEYILLVDFKKCYITFWDNIPTKRQCTGIY